MKQKPVEIEWIDAQSGMNSLFIDELKREILPVPTRSCGYLIHETKDFIVLGFMLFGDDLIKHYQLIPKCLIKKGRC